MSDININQASILKIVHGNDNRIEDILKNLTNDKTMASLKDITEQNTLDKPVSSGYTTLIKGSITTYLNSLFASGKDSEAHLRETLARTAETFKVSPKHIQGLVDGLVEYTKQLVKIADTTIEGISITSAAKEISISPGNK